MSGPLSLRLCCMAAMAPALTEATAQSCIKLSDTPPSDLSEAPSPGLKVITGTQNGDTLIHPTSNGDVTTGSDCSQRKTTTIISLTSDLKGKRSRGFLKPIQGNGRTASIYTINSSSVDEGLKNLGIIKGLPAFCRKVSVSKPNGNINYLTASVEKKMNKPVNGNGPNGSGKCFIRPTSTLEKRTVNGHGNPEVGGTLLQSKPQHQGISLMKIEPLSRNNLSQGQQQQMCRTSATPPAQASSSVAFTSGNNGRITSDEQRSASSLISQSNLFLKLAESTVASNTSSSASTDAQPDLIEDSKRKEHLLEKRSQFLMRRLRRLQGKQLESHVKTQLKAFTDFQHQNLQTVATRAIRPNSKNTSEFESGLFNSDDVKNLSTSALVSLVRKLQSSQPKTNIEQQLVNKKPKVETRGVLVMDRSNSAESSRVAGHLQANLAHWCSAVDSDATESSSGGESCDENEDFLKERKQMSVPLYKRAEWKWSVDRAAIVARWTWLQAQVADLEYRIRQQSEIYKTIRNSKGAVTLGQAAPPEDLLNPSQRTVGPSGDSNSAHSDKRPEVSPCNIATLLINVNRQASKLTQSLGNCYSPLQSSTVSKDILKNQSASKGLNGFLENSQSNLQQASSSKTPTSCATPSRTGDACPTTSATNATTTTTTGSVNLGPKTATPSSSTGSVDCASSNASPDLSHPLDATCQAARCRPLQNYRKRKLLRTAGLHQLNPKAARLSSVKCHCYPPVLPCTLCGGRYNSFQRLDAEGMPITEKCSLLDPAFHPVLSFPQEIPLPVHFEALLKSGEWQSDKSQKPTSRNANTDKRRQKLISATLKDQARKNRKKLTKSAAAVLLTSAKLRNKYEGKSPRNNSLPGTPKKKITAETRLRRKEMKRRRAAQLAIAALKRTNRAMSCPSSSGIGDFDGTGSRTPTPSPQLRDGGILSSSCPSSAMKELKDSAWKKRRESAYDINNIVIPYSMAASTRVERLQYKEILTPKWRDLTMEKQTEEEEDEEEEMDVTKEDLEAEKTEKVDENAEEEEEEGDEDISDESFIQRHLKCEAQEKKRFMSFVSYPPIRRGRVSRESESHTPDPLSPDFNLSESQFNSVISQSESSAREETRRRSWSTSSRRVSMFADMYGRDLMGGESMGDFQVAFLEPWQHRAFPLKEEEYNEMKLEQSQCVADHTQLYRRAKVVKLGQDSMCDFVTPFRSDSPSVPISPTPSGSSGSLIEDPNDPEWNALCDKPLQKTVVIKLAKR